MSGNTTYVQSNTPRQISIDLSNAVWRAYDALNINNAKAEQKRNVIHRSPAAHDRELLAVIRSVMYTTTVKAVGLITNAIGLPSAVRASQLRAHEASVGYTL